MLSKAELMEFMIQEYEHPFTGWDFSHIRDRIVSSPLPWSYSSKILPKIRKVKSLLDMGTGGGEFLAANFQPFPEHTCVTEAYEPNIPLAKKRLEPLGVKVFQIYDESHLPFKDEEFELIINQHESYDPKEVFRILKKKGEFVNKQVGGENDKDLAELLGAPFVENDWDLDFASKELEEVGFMVLEKYEAFPIVRIFDVGAIVYYCKIIPWSIPDFSIEKYKDKLFELHDTITNKGFIEVRDARFMIIAKK